LKKYILPFVLLLFLAAAGFIFGTNFTEFHRETAWRPGTPLDKERVKVGIIYIADAANTTNGYTYAHDIGIREVQRELGLRDDQIIRRYNVSDLDKSAAEHAIRECIADGANIIIATSWDYSNST
jgi:basic membrane protein A